MRFGEECSGKLVFFGRKSISSWDLLEIIKKSCFFSFLLSSFF